MNVDWLRQPAPRWMHGDWVVRILCGYEVVAMTVPPPLRPFVPPLSKLVHQYALAKIGGVLIVLWLVQHWYLEREAEPAIADVAAVLGLAELATTA